MATEAQIHANRENAAHSTGPTTEAGKQISSGNNLRHGLATGRLIIKGEDPAEYEFLRDGFLKVYQPADPVEFELVESMSQHAWLVRRAIYFQSTSFNRDFGGPDEKAIALYMRYQTSNHRAFHTCLNQLQKMRAELAGELIGFESQNQKKALNTAKIELLQAKTAAVQAATVAVQAKPEATPRPATLSSIAELHLSEPERVPLEPRHGMTPSIDSAFVTKIK